MAGIGPSAYSFLDVLASLAGPGGNLSLGQNGAGVAEEGITVSFDEDRSTMTKGADGTVMHSLHASSAGMVTIRVLKTAPLNALLSNMFDFQAQSGANWGQNVLSVTNLKRGDEVTAQNCAFKKKPDFQNAKEGGIVEWVFDAGQIHMKLGDGTAAV
jgi:hypothetical protein